MAVREQLLGSFADADQHIAAAGWDRRSHVERDVELAAVFGGTGDVKDPGNPTTRCFSAWNCRARAEAEKRMSPGRYDVDRV
eukprot:676893-Rhodomonas_salina.2